MKKGILLSILIITIVTSAVYAASSCEYDEAFDLDGDYIMSELADCGDEYQYDCDDTDKDVYKDCTDSLWKRFISWIKGENKSSSSLIAGNSVTSIIPQKLSDIKARIKNKNQVTDCEPVTICYDNDAKEIYCPLDYNDCCDSYSDCRIVECGMEKKEYNSEDDYTYTHDEEFCTEEYHNCYDADENIICKGDFERCAEAFDSCTCGTDNDTDQVEETAPEIDSSQTVECDTNVFICERQVITMNGDIADSIVTCKDSFQECSKVYGNCRCGNSSLTDFPTKKIGDIGDGSTDANFYWCEHNGKNVPCYMLPENCNKKKNTCDKGEGIMITCEGTIDYCNNRYDNTCLCGVEIISSGFMYGEEQ